MTVRWNRGSRRKWSHHSAQMEIHQNMRKSETVTVYPVRLTA